jgi:acetyl esterase/lipase
MTKNQLFKIHNMLVCALLLLMTIFSTMAAAQGNSAGVAEHLEIDYVASQDYANGKDRLDIFMPEGATNVPVVVYFHGGALLFGTKEIGHGLAKQLAARGVGVVCANYRLSPSVSHPAHMKDAAAAFAWTKKNIKKYGGNPNRVFVAGHSAGGYLAALLSLDPSYLSVHGMTLGDIRGTILISAFLYVEEQDVAPSRPKTVWGTDEQIWLKASATPYIGADKPAMLLLYADGDALWRREQNDRLKAELIAHGNSVELAMISDRTHSSINTKMGENDDIAMAKIGTFVANH